MKVSGNLRESIADELGYVAKRMREEADPARRNYFFSAAYAVVFRIFNLEFDPSLVLVHQVLQGAYGAINNRVESVRSGQERAIGVAKELFDSLGKAVEELGDAIRNNKDLSQALEKIAVISYTTTGNGYYLYQKGTLTI